MSFTVEQMLAAQKANVETLFGLTNKAFEGVEKLVELNLQVAKTSLTEAPETTKAAMSVKDAQELLALQASLLQPAAEKAAAYSRHLYDIVAGTNAEVTKAAEATAADAQKMVLTMVVIAEPWHSTLGLITLGLSALPLLWWAQGRRSLIPRPSTASATGALQPFPPVKPWIGLSFLLACAGIILLPSRPLDVARPQTAPALPERIALFAAQPGVLTAKEQAYFTRYGGGAARAAYGPYGLLVVSTSAPLRHLHSPEECLAGSGHTVRYLGQTGGVTPSAVYRSTDPQGQSWRITVSFVSERGEWTPHVAEAIWRWLQAPGTTWRMIQRIAPWQLPETAVEHFDAAVWRALDLSPSAVRGPLQPLTVKL